MESPSLSVLPVGLGRRFAAIVYDSLLLFSVLFFAAAVAYPFTQGQVSLVFRIYLLIVSFLYFAGSWLRGGQTLGMLAWRIRLCSMDDKKLTWWQVIRRFIVAILSWLALGIGFFWALGNKQRYTWHDWASQTRLIYLPK